MTCRSTSGLVGLLLFLSSASASLTQPTTPQMKREHEPGHSFGNAKTWAKEFDDPARDVWQKPDEILDALQLAPTARVADIGAGTGYFSVRIAKLVPDGKVFAVDIEPDMVRYLGERTHREHSPCWRVRIVPICLRRWTWF